MKKYLLIFFWILSLNIFANPPINPTRYKDFLIKKLSSDRFSPDGEKMVRQAASNWAKLVDSGYFEKVYNSDEFLGTYWINTNNLPSDLIGIDFLGSDDKVMINAFGKTVIKNTGDANTIIAHYTSEYLSLQY